MSNVSLVNGHIDSPELTDSEIPKHRIKAIYPHITVGGNIDKPCYSIEWYDIDENTMHSGFSSYNLEFVRKWLEEEFEVVEADIDNLINRQKSVIERLNKRIAGQKHSLFEQQSYTAELQNELKTIKSEAVKEFAERVNPIIEELVDIMFDDDHSKCMIKNCHKHSSIPCESVVCIDENKTFWKLKIYNLLNEMVDAPSVSEADSFLKDGADGRVVKGKWLINPDGYYPYCSECKEEPKGRIMTKFCPECGADMRGEKNEQI